MTARRFHIVHAIFLLALSAQIALWLHAHRWQGRWANVPPAPATSGVNAFGLGDAQFSFRSVGIMLQNLGSSGGRSIPLRDYNFERLGRWFFLADRLDPHSDFIPNLAAFYFSATQDSSQLTPIVDYLAMVGRRSEGEKWRWLAQAVFLARFRQHDMNKALVLSGELAKEWKPGLPIWMKEMPVLVMTAAGDKKSAYALMLAILREEAGKIQAPEINSMIVYVCTRILDPAEARVDPLCVQNAELLK